MAGWIVTGYFVSHAISMTFMGRVSDIAGRRAVYLICLVIFFVGSWVVAASPGWPTEIAQRIVQLFRRASRCRIRLSLRLDCRPCHSGLRRRRDGAGEHGPRRRPVST